VNLVTKLRRQSESSGRDNQVLDEKHVSRGRVLVVRSHVKKNRADISFLSEQRAKQIQNLNGKNVTSAVGLGMFGSMSVVVRGRLLTLGVVTRDDLSLSLELVFDVIFLLVGRIQRKLKDLFKAILSVFGANHGTVITLDARADFGIEVVQDLLSLFEDRSSLNTVLGGLALSDCLGNGLFHKLFPLLNERLFVHSSLSLVGKLNFDSIHKILTLFDGLANLKVVDFTGLKRKTVLQKSEFAFESVDYIGLHFEVVTKHTG